MCRMNCTVGGEREAIRISFKPSCDLRGFRSTVTQKSVTGVCRFG